MTMWTYVGLSLIVISAVFVFPNVFAFEFYEKNEWLGVDEEYLNAVEFLIKEGIIRV